MADPRFSSYAWPPYAMMDGSGEWPNYSNPQNWPPQNNFYWPGFQYGSGKGSGLGAGTIILVAVLVTGFSLMALLILRLWFCGCSQDDDARRPGRRIPLAVIGNGQKLVYGLRKEQIDSFQVVNYGSLLAARGGEDEEGERLGCPVCLVDFVDEDKMIRVLPGCGHSFHSECIDMWLFSHTSCPVCRRDLQQQQQQSDHSCTTSNNVNGSSMVSSDHQVVIDIAPPQEEQQPQTDSQQR